MLPWPIHKQMNSLRLQIGCNLPRLDITKRFGSMKRDRGRERVADREGGEGEGGVIGWAAGKGDVMLID